MRSRTRAPCHLSPLHPSGNFCFSSSQRYFPENFKFWPFGDPFIEKRRHDARKKREAEAEAQRKANPSANRTWKQKSAWGADY